MGFRYRLPPATDCNTCEYRFRCYTKKIGFCAVDDIWDETHGKRHMALNGVPAHQWRTYEFLIDGNRRQLTAEEIEFAFEVAGDKLSV